MRILPQWYRCYGGRMAPAPKKSATHAVKGYHTDGATCPPELAWFDGTIYVFYCDVMLSGKTFRRIGQIAGFFRPTFSLQVKLQDEKSPPQCGPIPRCRYLCKAVWSVVKLCRGATSWGIGPRTTKGISHQQDSSLEGSCFLMPWVAANAKKNPPMSRLRLISVIPQCSFSLFFRLVKVSSILLFVFGMPSQPSCWNLKRYGI